MAEVVVGAVVDQLVSEAVGWIKEEISLLKGVKRKLHNMKKRMQTIQTVLEDAENQSVKREIVKHWLKELQDVSYDTDDLLDEWSTRVHMLQREREEAEENNTSSQSPTAAKITCFSLKKLNCFSSIEQLPWRREIALRIKDINERIKLVFSEMKDFKLASKAVGNDGLDKIINNKDIVRTTTSFIDESKMFGRDDEKKILLRKVLSLNTEHENSLQVISIVGAGGLGKTTLAQMVYNDGKVKEKFGGNRIWICVSNPFDEFKVAKDILAALKVDQTNMISLENFHQAIRESLSGHKFLLVLDDVWEEIPDKWEKLRICLKLRDSESRILVTTRKEEVARIMGTPTSNILTPRLISDLDCWALMSRIVFQGRTNEGNDDLDDIGKKIAKKCNGLPLAAKTLGGILRSTLGGGMLKSKECVDRWNEILNSKIWELEQAEVELFPHIFLSYQDLPAMLKRCFLILAIFPKDTKLEAKEVIRIWMAHGFLNPRTKKDDMVNTGHKYIEFLVSRALLLLEEHRIHGISMHDIIHDFALHLLGDEVISIDKIENDNGIESTSERGCVKSTKARHLYIGANKDATSIGFDVKKLRTCIIRDVAPNITSDLVKGLKWVRALYLADCGLEEVPESIGNLIHLRLLDLSDNPFIELPETIGGLYNLQELLLERTGLSTLPDSIGKLTNLIFLRSDRKLRKLPESVGKLINLQHLGGPVPVEAGKSKLGFLKDLNQLRGELKIEFWRAYDDEDDVKKAAIQKKKHITKLDLSFYYPSDPGVPDGVIAALRPPSNLQELKMKDLKGSSLPGWITSLHHLTELEVYSAPNISTLPPLGEFQSLKTLHLSHFKALRKIGRECWGQKNDEVFVAFPTLLKLVIWECESLEEWEDIKAEDEGKVTLMPKLQYLEILRCSKLKVLPSRLLCRAASLEELWCSKISSSLEAYIKNDKQLLRRVKSVNINDRQCSLHPESISEYEWMEMYNSLLATTNLV